MARPEKCRRICSRPSICGFIPDGSKAAGSVVLSYDEYETIRLIDRENMDQLACAEKMGVSRSTAARIYGNARKKLADALVGGKALKIDGGDVIVCAKMRPECKDVVNCCHKKQLQDA